MSATPRQIVAQPGKLYSCVAAWIGSHSTAARTSNPACSSDLERPPAPANRSTPMGLCRLCRIPLLPRVSRSILAGCDGFGSVDRCPAQRISLIIFFGPTNRLRFLEPLVPAGVTALDWIGCGEVVKISQVQ